MSKTCNEGQIYAVLFSGNIVKVGRGRSALERIREHKRSAKIWGAKAIDKVHSSNVPNAHLAERKLIDFCKRKGVLVHGSEWFKIDDFESVRDLIGHLDKNHILSKDGRKEPCENEDDKKSREFLGKIFGPVGHKRALCISGLLFRIIEKTCPDHGFDKDFLFYSCYRVAMERDDQDIEDYFIEAVEHPIDCAFALIEECYISIQKAAQKEKE